MVANACFCGREGAVFLHYADKHLCESHFIRMFDKRFRKTVRMQKMLKKGERVAVALSGGKDSCVLLNSLAEIKKDLPFELNAITIDEGIRGYRPKTLVAAKRECEKLGIVQTVVSFREAAGSTLDSLVRKTNDGLPCSHCGVVRRRLLNDAARELKADRLAIGHNLDDIAQTVLMNFMRNEPSRLARFNDPKTKSARFVQRIRPLMLTPEKEIAIYAMLKGIHVERIECPYAGFAFRGQVRKMLNETEELYPGTKFKVVNSFLWMEDALRSKYGPKKLSMCESCGEPSSGKTCAFCRSTKS